MTDYKDQIFQFLTGTLPKVDYKKFIEAVNNSKELQKELEIETTLESLFYSAQWNSEDIINKNILNSDNTNFEIPENEFKKLLPKRDNNLVFKKKPFYAIAAILLISFTLLLSYLSLNNNATYPTHVKIQNAIDKDSTNVSNQVAKNSPTKTIPDKEQISVIKNSNFKKVQLSNNVSYIKKGITNFKVLKNIDSMAIIHLLNGEMQFFVKTGSYKKFAVVTKHAEIRVTGTIFSVYTDSTKTNATVYRGSVQITDKIGNRTDLKANDNKQCSISDSGIIDNLISNSLILRKNDNLLSRFLSQYRDKNKEQLPINDILSEIDLERDKILSLINTNNDMIVNAQLMHLNAANRLIRSGDYNKSEEILKKLIDDDISEDVYKLAVIKLGKLYYKTLNNNSFKERFLNYINENPKFKFAENYYLLILLSYVKDHDYSEFKNLVNKFIQKYPENKFLDILIWNLSQINLTEKDYEKAIINYEEIINNYPNSQNYEKARYWLGWCLINKPKKFSGIKNK